MPYPGPYDTPQGIGARVEAMDLLYAMQRHVDFSYSILPPSGEPQQRAG